MDNKILAKITATCLFSIIGKIIHADQTVFLQGQYSFDNTRKLFNVIHQLKNLPYSAAVCTIDAEKTVDCIKWSFMFYTLQKLGFGNNFTQWIKMLYTKPMASIKNNNQISKPFIMNRGTKQGCPLSGLLFNLVTEPLAAKVRSDKNIHGIKTGDQSNKLSLYCEDIILYLVHVDTSLHCLNELLTRYGHISGYKVNRGKWELLPLIKHCKKH